MNREPAGPIQETPKPLLRLTDVSKTFKLEAGLFATAGRYVWAVNGVSLDVYRGETYGLVGESGSGKTTLARSIVQLVRHSGGTIRYYPGAASAQADTPGPWDIGSGNRQILRSFRTDVKYIFQDPSSALDPRMTVYEILTAGAKYGLRTDAPGNLRTRAGEVMDAVGLRVADLERRPAEFSGGQRQRISLARALFGKPEALICDEVVSALDVSIQGQILNLLVELKRQYDLTILFIAHDLTVVSYMADRIGVLYGGSLMEEAPSDRLVSGPLHPYTQLLYNSVPRLGTHLADRAELIRAPGTPYNPTAKPTGCPFSGRCPMVQPVCLTERPALHVVASSGPGLQTHRVACHFVD
ncbi:MAG TPA: ABC transporter ATP-binding protein [Spirochaetia bacterium]|nr:ABC transporter ATP-binding protein [Spirochaetia bacterium]